MTQAKLIWLNKENTKYTYEGFETKIEFEVIQQVRHETTLSRLTKVHYIEAQTYEFELMILKNGEIILKKTYTTLNGAKRRILKYIPVEVIMEARGMMV